MAIPLGAQLHFRAFFTLRPEGDGVAPPRAIFGAIRRWISGRMSVKPPLETMWFMNGGNWVQPRGNRVHITTRAVSGREAAPALSVWAVEFQHPDGEHKYRQWATEIGIEVIGDLEIRVGITVSHWVLSSYIGGDLPQPVASAPGLVADLLSLPGLDAYAGSERLLATPKRLSAGEGVLLRDRIVDSGRRVPLIYVALPFARSEPACDVVRLSRLVAGAATVSVATTSLLDKETEALLPPAFRCWNGMIRVYHPRVKLESDSDAGRHRYFTHIDLQAQGAENCVAMIVRSIVRRGMSAAGASVLSIQDVDLRKREARLQALRSANEEVPKWIWDDLDAYVAEIAKLKAQVNEAIEAREEREEAAAETASRVSFWKAEAEQLRLREDAWQTQLDALRHLAVLPGSLRAVCELIGKLQQGRVAFTPAALTSAAKAEFNDVADAWSLLWSVATTLWTLYFEEEASPDEVMSQFRVRSGYELTLTESGQTNKDKKLAAKRVITFEGSEWDISAHVKTRDRKTFLRVHYAVDRAKRRVIVGYCGDHLDTAGTRRRS